MENLKVQLRTQDGTKSSEVTIPVGLPAKELIEGAIDRWQLPTEGSYTLSNTRTGREIPAAAMLDTQQLQSGDTLSINPVMTAG